MNTALWSRFKHFGRLLGKIYPFLTPTKTDGRVPSQQGAPTTCNLTYRRVQTLLASLGVVIWQNSASGGGGGGAGRGGSKGHWVWPKDENHPLSGRTDILRNRSIGCPWRLNFKFCLIEIMYSSDRLYCSPWVFQIQGPWYKVTYMYLSFLVLISQRWMELSEKFIMKWVINYKLTSTRNFYRFIN